MNVASKGDFVADWSLMESLEFLKNRRLITINLAEKGLHRGATEVNLIKQDRRCPTKAKYWESLKSLKNTWAFTSASLQTEFLPASANASPSPFSVSLTAHWRWRIDHNQSRITCFNYVNRLFRSLFDMASHTDTLFTCTHYNFQVK